jgi:hypothetical protein
LGVSQKILELKCPKCQDLIRIRIDRSMLEKAKRLPISVSYIHGDPMHSTTIWVDNDFVIRAVEAPDDTILGHGISTTGEQRSTLSTQGEIPGEAELTDEATAKLEAALETISKMSGEIVLILTGAHDELTKLSELRRRGAARAAGTTEKRAFPEPKKTTKRATRILEPRVSRRDY